MSRKRLLLIAGGIVLVTIVAVILILYSQRIDFFNLSVEQLASTGYYAYVLPETIQNELGWKRRIVMFSVDEHCYENISEYNPKKLNIRYDNELGKFALGIRISPDDEYFPPNERLQIIPLDAEWIPSRTGVYYSHGRGNSVLVRDTFGMDVVIDASRKDISQVAEFIGKLEYGGPDPATVGNPWEKACQ